MSGPTPPRLVRRTCRADRHEGMVVSWRDPSSSVACPLCARIVAGVLSRASDRDGVSLEVRQRIAAVIDRPLPSHIVARRAQLPLSSTRRALLCMQRSGELHRTSTRPFLYSREKP